MLTREEKIEQSVQDYTRERLFTIAGYSGGDVVLEDAFPEEKFDGPLEKTHVAFSFNFDDGGRPAEIGSNLTARVYTLTFFVFGLTGDWGSNIANVIKAAIEDDMCIDLLDYADFAKPVISQLEVDGITVQRQYVRDPRPWERFIWTTTVKVTDTYVPDAFS